MTRKGFQNSSRPATRDGEASATPTLFVNDAAEEGVVVKSLEDVREPSLDPRVSIEDANRPTEDELDETISHRFTSALRRHESKRDSLSEKGIKQEEPLYIEFAPGDKRNPINFSMRRKWTITGIACFATLLASTTASTYNMGFESMVRDLNCTYFQATIGLSLYALGFGVVPLVSASFSEEFGRQPLYVASGIGFLLMYMMIALRGLPMSIFALAAVGGTGLGPVFAGWIEMDSNLQWKWIQWIQMMWAFILLS
ncbi:hypothetical protein NLJ89_g11005 [Agrocybe chaxingu]|uniref:Major facilitator superfamily (MFS) profile domain-containing protein n=1 Tax=Agrocybe chaxingu TaxID=84603 RepID=A0A9W8MRK2_9AGAR|nr:hypothetical protein NLJ89_g11005 [Agrocybe chaxingu]